MVMDTDLRKLPSIDLLSGSDVVELNVGGQIFVTSRATLNFEQESMLAKLVAKSSPFAQRLDSSGRIFIDQDGDTFAYILGYLRRGGRLVGAPYDLASLARLKVDAEFFGLTGLVKEVLKRRPSIEGLRAAIGSQNGWFISTSDLVSLDYSPSVLKLLRFTAREAREGGCCAASLLDLCERVREEELRTIIEKAEPIIVEDKFGVAMVEQEKEEACEDLEYSLQPVTYMKIAVIRILFDDGTTSSIPVKSFLANARVVSFRI